MRVILQYNKFLIKGDLNVHVGYYSNSFDTIYGEFDYRMKNELVENILNDAIAHDLILINNFLEKENGIYSTTTTVKFVVK